MNLVTARQARKWLPRRSAGAHKGSVGRIYIVGGSRGMAGAPVLTALGAVNAGAGLVRIGTVHSQQKVVALRAPLEVTVDDFSEDAKGALSVPAAANVMRAVADFDSTVVAAGPGLRVTSGTRHAIGRLMSSKTPLVLDADGLNALSTMSAKFLGPAILTPHPGELARLLKISTKAVQSDREKRVLQAAKKFNAVCLLKGPGTLVSDGDTVWKNSSGNAQMASAGMGDVLTGIIAALWAQMGARRNTALEAAALGAYVHGLAGDIAARQLGGLSVSASQVANQVRSALRRLKTTSK